MNKPNKRQLDELRAALERECARLAGDAQWADRMARDLGEAQADEGASFGNLSDIATDLAGQEVAVALSQAEHQRLDDVRQALHRLESGVYGTCATCGGPIATERLRAIPWTRTCQSCARAAEARRST